MNTIQIGVWLALKMSKKFFFTGGCFVQFSWKTFADGNRALCFLTKAAWCETKTCEVIWKRFVEFLLLSLFTIALTEASLNTTASLKFESIGGIRLWTHQFSSRNILYLKFPRRLIIQIRSQQAATDFCKIFSKNCSISLKVLSSSPLC